jgi:hypothetical protein
MQCHWQVLALKACDTTNPNRNVIPRLNRRILVARLRPPLSEEARIAWGRVLRTAEVV